MNACIVIDITRTLDRALQGRLPTGVDRVSREYVRHFGADAQALVRFGGRWIFMSRRRSRRVFDALLRNPRKVDKARLRWWVGCSYVQDWRQPAAASVLLNTGHSGLQDAGYATRVQRLGLRPLYFLHDLIPITHPEYCRPGEAAKHEQRLATMLSTGCGLLANSVATAEELRGYAQRVGSAVPPLGVALLAPARLARPRAERPWMPPYFVMLGTIEPRKNHLLLLNVWRALVQRDGERAPRLVIVGQRGWECEQVLDLLDRCEALRGFVLERQGCDDTELATLLAHAQALLFPSFAEGYGMPMVEALAAGVPVLASDLPVFREVAGDVPEYLDPLDGPGWIRAIDDYVHMNGARRRAQLARMHGWQAPTWKAHFDQVHALMRRCLSTYSL